MQLTPFNSNLQGKWKTKELRIQFSQNDFLSCCEHSSAQRYRFMIIKDGEQIICPDKCSKNLWGRNRDNRIGYSHRAWKMNHLIVNSGNFLEAISTSSYGNQLLTIKYLGCIVHYYEAHSESFWTENNECVTVVTSQNKPIIQLDVSRLLY